MYVCMHVYTSIPVAPPSPECPFAPAAFGLAADTAIARSCDVCNYIICMYVYMYVRYEYEYEYEYEYKYKYKYKYEYKYKYKYKYTWEKTALRAVPGWNSHSFT